MMRGVGHNNTMAVRDKEPVACLYRERSYKRSPGVSQEEPKISSVRDKEGLHTSAGYVPRADTSSSSAKPTRKRDMTVKDMNRMISQHVTSNLVKPVSTGSNSKDPYASSASKVRDASALKMHNVSETEKTPKSTKEEASDVESLISTMRTRSYASTPPL